MSDKERFAAAWQRVVVVFGEPAEPTYAVETWRAMSAFRADLYDDTASRLIAEQQWMPKPSEWTAMARRIDGERTMADVRRRAEAYASSVPETTYHCYRCQDTGWELGLSCTPGNLCAICQRTGRHLYDHTLTRPCECRERNPTYLKKRDAAGQIVQGRTASKGQREAA